MIMDRLKRCAVLVDQLNHSQTQIPTGELNALMLWNTAPAWFVALEPMN